MEIFQLEQFLAIAETENMREASEKLFITQSALGQNLKKLEEELGVLLFDRVGRRLVLNTSGKLLQSYAAKILDDVDEFHLQLDALRDIDKLEDRPISVGGDDSGFLSYVLPLCVRAQSGFDVLGKLLTNTEEAFTRALVRNEVDVTVGMKDIGNPISRISSVPILERQLFISVPESNKALYDKKILTPYDLDGQPCLTDFSKASSRMKGLFKKMGVHPINAYQTDRSSFPLLYDNPDLLYLVNVFRLLQYKRVPGRRLIKFQLPEGQYDPLYYMSYRSSNPYGRKFYEWFMNVYYDMFRNVRIQNYN